MTRGGAGTPPARWRLVTIATFGMLVLQVGWILAVPPFFGIDEIDHTYRASSVAEGHWLPRDTTSDETLPRGLLVAVRADVPAAAHDACRQFPYMARQDCTPVSAAPGQGEVLIASTAALYNPLFYAATEVVAVHAHGYANLYLMRATAAVFCALMFAAGVWSTLVRSRSRWPLAMFLLAMTPTTLYSSTLVAPNGLEMVSGLTFASALFGLFVGRTAPRRSERIGLLLVASGSGAALVTVHTLGPLWLALTTVLVLLVAGPRPVWRRLREAPRGHLAAASVIGGALAGSIAWVLVSGANQAPSASGRVPGSAYPGVLLGIVYWPIQAVATFPSRDDPAPIFVYPIVLALVAAALYRAAPGLRGRLGLAALFVVGASFALPIALTLLTYHQYGMAWQGRYGMPFTAGFFLVLGLALERRPSSLPRPVLVLAGVLSAVVLVACEQGVIHRQLTLAVLRDNPHWHVPHLLVLAGLAALGVALWASALAALPGRVVTADPGPSDVRDTEQPVGSPHLMADLT